LALPVPASDAASLHLIGTRDWWRSESEEHARCFEDSTTYVHAHGHEIPMRLMGDEKLKQELGRFLQRFDPQQSGPGRYARAPARWTSLYRLKFAKHGRIHGSAQLLQLESSLARRLGLLVPESPLQRMPRLASCGSTAVGL